MKKADIVVPIMNEEEVTPLFYEEIKRVTASISDYRFNIIFIDDGSTDDTLKVIRSLAEKDRSVKYISFSRNFGKEAAIYAGLKNAGGDIVILMDGDLEHPPALIPEMLYSIDSRGFEACGAKRETGFSSRMFANINNSMSNIKIKKGATDYMCMTRRFVDSVLMLTETQRFTKGLFAWVGFDVDWIDYEQPVRPKGRSKWSARKLFNYAADGITSFSTKPLRVVTGLGAVIFIMAFIYIIITLIKTWITGIDVPGYVTTLVAILFMGGIILLAIGVLGEYVGRIYLESKDRPMYIVGSSNLDSGRSGNEKKRNQDRSFSGINSEKKSNVQNVKKMEEAKPSDSRRRKDKDQITDGSGDVKPEEANPAGGRGRKAKERISVISENEKDSEIDPSAGLDKKKKEIRLERGSENNDITDSAVNNTTDTEQINVKNNNIAEHKRKNYRNNYYRKRRPGKKNREESEHKFAQNRQNT